MGCSAKPAGLVSQAVPKKEGLALLNLQRAKLTSKSVRTR